MVDLLLLCRRKKTLSSQECNNKLLCGCTCCYNTCLSEGVFPVQSGFPSFATLKKKKKRLEDCIWKFMFMSLLSLQMRKWERLILLTDKLCIFCEFRSSSVFSHFLRCEFADLLLLPTLLSIITFVSLNQRLRSQLKYK